MIHEVREKWNMMSNCPCGRSRFGQMASKNGLITQISSSALATDSKPDTKGMVNGVSHPGIDAKVKKKLSSKLESGGFEQDPLKLLAEAAASRESESSGGSKDRVKSSKGSNSKKTPVISTVTDSAASAGGKSGGNPCSTLRDLLTRTAANKLAASPHSNDSSSNKKSVITPSSYTLDDVIKNVSDGDRPKHGESPKRVIHFMHYRPKSGISMQGRDEPIPLYTLEETRDVFPDTPHSWLDQGRLLRLLDSRCEENLQLFQQQWRRGQPVMVSHCQKHLDQGLWRPQAFLKEFGSAENDLVNCFTHTPMVGHKMKLFWEGFEKLSGRYMSGIYRCRILTVVEEFMSMCATYRCCILRVEDLKKKMR